MEMYRELLDLCAYEATLTATLMTSINDEAINKMVEVEKGVLGSEYKFQADLREWTGRQYEQEAGE